MRAIAAAFLLALAAAAAVMSWGALQNLFGGYRDSPVTTYLLFGVPWLALAGAAAVSAVRLLRR